MNNNILHKNQYGFRKNCNAETQIVDLLCFISNSFNDINVKYVDIIFIDKSNALVIILHGKLIDELREVGIVGTFLPLINSLLGNRKQYVIYKSVKSKHLDLNSGTPQGWILSPTFFNIYVRD